MELQGMKNCIRDPENQQENKKSLPLIDIHSCIHILKTKESCKLLVDIWHVGKNVKKKKKKKLSKKVKQKDCTILNG